jgi:hypothetical protein
MQTSRTAIAVSVGLTALIAGAGGLIGGYWWGHLDSRGQNAPAQSALAALVLKLQRRGEVDTANLLLERSLDTSLTVRGIYDLLPHPLAPLVADENAETKALQFAADYRAEFPRSDASAWERDSIDRIVSRYKSGGAVPPNKSLERTRER